MSWSVSINCITEITPRTMWERGVRKGTRLKQPVNLKVHLKPCTSTQHSQIEQRMPYQQPPIISGKNLLNWMHDIDGLSGRSRALLYTRAPQPSDDWPHQVQPRRFGNRNCTSKFWRDLFFIWVKYKGKPSCRVPGRFFRFQNLWCQIWIKKSSGPIPLKISEITA